MATQIPFKDRLRQLLDEKHPRSGGQAWLAKASGAERSTISRILAGRLPSQETLELIAPALGLTVEELVRGTTAESKVRSGPDFVSQEHYSEAIAKMLEFERRATDAEALLRERARTVHDETERRRRAEEENAQNERTSRDLRDQLSRAHSEISHLQHRVRRRTEALEKAVRELNELRTRVAELKEVADDSRKAGRVTAILAAVAAFTGVVSMATYLNEDDDD